MTARGQSIGISIGMLPQTLIISITVQKTGMLPQTLIISITVQKTSKYYTTEFDLQEGF